MMATITLTLSQKINGFAKKLPIILPSILPMAILITTAMMLPNRVQAEPLDAKTQTLYNESCVTCHAIGALGAPKTGDKASWTPRLKQGMPTLVSHTKSGFKNMPAGGLCDKCTDNDFAKLINFMSQ